MKIWVPKLYRAALTLMSPLTTEEAYKAIIDEACDLTESKYGSIFLDKNSNLERVYSSVPLEHQTSPAKNGFTYQAFRSHEIVIASVEEMKRIHEYNPEKAIRFLIFVPLSYEGISLGVISLHSMRKRRFSDKKIQMLQLFGSLASLKVRNGALITELQSAIETRDLFISMASHELKTPMTTILASAQLLKRKVSKMELVAPKLVDNLDIAAKRMSRLINELLHINQIRSGALTYEMEACNADEFIKEALLDVKYTYPAHTFNLDIDPKVKTAALTCDKDRIVQVLINILNNAAKFSQSSSPILLKVKVLQKKIEFAVIDKGPGIGEKDLEHLFEEFYKAKRNDKEGLGLGLYIAKQIVAKHKGEIKVSSVLGEGTTVKLLLPLK